MKVHAAVFIDWQLRTCSVNAERHEEILPAIARKKLVKKWRRDWKIALIEADNPDWRDL